MLDTTMKRCQNYLKNPKSATKYKKRLFWYGQASPLGWHPVKRLKGNAFVKWVRTRARHPLAWTKYWLYKQIKISFVPQRPTPIPFSVHHHDHQISDNLIRTFSQSFPIVWTFSPRELNFFVAIVLRWILGSDVTNWWDLQKHLLHKFEWFNRERAQP